MTLDPVGQDPLPPKQVCYTNRALCVAWLFQWISFFTCDQYKIYENVPVDVLVQCFEGQSKAGNGS